MKVIIPFAILILLSFSSCYNDSQEYLYPSLKVCDTSNVTYSVCVNLILDETCRSCHGGNAASGGGIKLNTYEEVMKTVDNGKLLGSIKWLNGYKQMPKGSSKLENIKIETIQKWVDNGAPNN